MDIYDQLYAVVQQLPKNASWEELFDELTDVHPDITEVVDYMSDMPQFNIYSPEELLEIYDEIQQSQPKSFRRNPDSPLKTGVVNYRNRPFNKFYMVDIYVGNQSPAGQIKVAVDDLSGKKPKRIIVPYGQHLRDEYASPLMVAPPSIPEAMEPEMQFGPYKSRRAAAVDAKTIVRNILLGTGDGGTGGTITEMYELTDGGSKYLPFSSLLVVLLLAIVTRQTLWWDTWVFLTETHILFMLVYRLFCLTKFQVH
jgi:hypothetical protein